MVHWLPLAAYRRAALPPVHEDGKARHRRDEEEADERRYGRGAPHDRLVTDDEMQELVAAVLRYPGVPTHWREPDLEAPRNLVLAFELDLGDGRIARMFGTETTLSTPQDVTLQELRIESFHPADVETEAMVFDAFG
jgi:hypothetical protein